MAGTAADVERLARLQHEGGARRDDLAITPDDERRAKQGKTHWLVGRHRRAGQGDFQAGCVGGITGESVGDRHGRRISGASDGDAERARTRPAGVRCQRVQTGS